MSEATITQKSWQDIAAAKQAERLSKIPAEWIIPESLVPPPDQDFVQDFPRKSGFFTASELEITESTASFVVSKISRGEWSALEVIKATAKRAAVAQQLINCLTEICFDDAFARASQLDEFFRREGKTVGPLHGLPISLKDQFNLEGLDSTIGYAGYAGRKPSEESTLVTLLRNAGAVLYVKTNIPTTLMMGESVNNLFGRTLNPRNRKLTTGGSSGGESALVTFCGSFMGVGTDIGGSIRHPASYTGLYALRPSHGRVSYQQVTNTFLGQEAVRSCAGPLCRSPEDVKLFMKGVVDQKPWLHDPQVVPIPWRAEEEQLPTKLCFGWATGDGYVTAAPPLKRAMEIVKAKLLAAGHSVIDYVPYELKEADEIIKKMWVSDGGEEVRRDQAITGEPFPPAVESIYGLSNHSLQPLKVFQTWENQHQRALLSQRWLERWQKTSETTGTGRPIDALIMPSTPFPAIRHNGRYPWNYGVLSPLLDLTTGVFPVTKVDVVKDQVPADWRAISQKDQEIRDFYEKPENHENALVGLTIIGRRLEEEKIVALLGLLGNTVGTDYVSTMDP